MNTLVLRAATRGLAPLMVLASLYLLLRGHDAVGGGFIGALVAGAAVALRHFAGAREGSRVAELMQPHRLIGGGLLIGVAAGLAGLANGGPMFRVLEAGIPLPLVGEYKVTGALAFDVGVYLVVVGMIVAAVIAFGEEREDTT